MGNNKPKAYSGKNRTKQKREDKRRSQPESKLNFQNNHDNKSIDGRKVLQSISSTSLSELSDSIQTDDLHDVLDEFEGRGRLILEGYESASSKPPSRQQSNEDLQADSVIKIDLQKSADIGELLERIDSSVNPSSKVVGKSGNNDYISTDSLNFVFVQKHELKRSKSYEELLNRQQEQNGKGFLGRFFS
ncbi:MAG: hypothetical protein PQ612_02470 [Rickettsiales bacterium]|nr:hypothetical protein [Pseudomonadota bacterium]MDA0966023.1 hypothetical protein [Pseudomonadota bacterium]MDG4542506.1 hypothetical protein [Rickettsiales bacterium]MDG4545010.1 hypothetical protein [Rickettsiales bacterium]MDG4547133.1 hypothetical protein [Rickettsiales bacterium]